MKISDALRESRHILDSKGVSNSKLDSLILLSHAFFLCGEEATKERIIFNPDLLLDEEKQKTFFHLVARRAKREPISHIINRREFYGEDFFVNSDVLDPRPDSESLIEEVFKKFPEKNRQLKILELGVGSGCLIITLLKAFQEADGIGVDISDAALKIAQKNAEFHKIDKRLTLKKSDLFSVLDKEKFDLIISNPPYIPAQEIEALEPEVKIYEPKTALDGGADGLDFYRRIADAAQNFLNKKGQIILEIGFGQKEKIVEIFTQEKFLLNGVKLDLSGVERVLCFVIPSCIQNMSKETAEFW